MRTGIRYQGEKKELIKLTWSASYTSLVLYTFQFGIAIYICTGDLFCFNYIVVME